ncbi:MAG: hypothetical protein EOO41_02680 [Methanobacteriota archaeon]|nr:MAG: hypothetical protein EOO41_02680 [Euryarchaeota archaeon]
MLAVLTAAAAAAAATGGGAHPATPLHAHHRADDVAYGHDSALLGLALSPDSSTMSCALRSSRRPPPHGYATS